MPPEARERLALQIYLKQLEQPQVAFGVRQRRPVTLDEAVTATLEMESYVVPPRSCVQLIDSNRDSETEAAPVAAVDSTTKLTLMMEKLMERVETLERKNSLQSPRGSREEDSPSTTPNRRPRRGTVICWNCRQPGHIARTCRRPVQNQGNEIPPVERATRRGE